MPRRSITLLSRLSDRPEIEQLERFLQRLLEERSDDLEFVVLFGSMARGDWSRGSDYDVIVGLRGEDGQRFIDRIGAFSALADGNIDVLPYSRSEWERMATNRALILLEALEDGIAIWDRGGFARLQGEFRTWRASGLVTPSGTGWRIMPTVEE